MTQHVETSWLTWERASRYTNTDFNLANRYIDPPEKLGNHYPSWFKDLKADIRNYLPEGTGQNHTARVCLGLRGVNTVGWTLPHKWDVDRGHLEFHPEQLHGTKWAEKDSHGEYVWRLLLIAYPWRAKLPRGFRLLMADYPLEFSNDWHTFSGCVDANYRLDENQQMGSIYWFDEPMDSDYNYYNIENVVAIRKGCCIPAGTVSFSIIPLWDPDHDSTPGRIPFFA